MPREWQPVVDGFSPVMKLVHLAMRMDAVDQEALRAELLRARRSFFEEELTAQAERVGCRTRRGHLANGPILSQLNDDSLRDSASIVNTYNYDLASAIARIRTDTPRANRWTYAKRLGAWDAKRASWKEPQIAQYTEISARGLAQQHFYNINGSFGTAVLRPEPAVCPVCIGWVARGEVPLAVAMANPPPYHPNCCPPDVSVLMADDTEKPISQVEEGEVVGSRWGSSTVIQVHRRQTREALYRISVGGRVLRLTGDHPVLTERGWIPARELQVGERVATHRCHGCRPDGS